ncbi:MAG: UDP-2,3-diacylglucosamine diphosphatase LpxI [Opitutales bacterium]|nr:UDP-2,3-diacylglucosamine diphosphatase LpxI [Opitutales bacterium]
MTLPSKYLPDDFDSAQPVAVVAGQRDYPVLTVEALRRAGVPVRLIAFEGETREDLWNSFPESERARIHVGQIGHMLKALRRLGARYAVFVGQITPGRLFRDLKPDLKALAILARLRERNAETIFGAIVDEVTKANVRMLDARAFLDEHLAAPGVMTGKRLQAEPDHIAHGVRIAREVARLDIGQSVVVRKGTVLAVEAFEGTDDMIRRANKYKTDRLILVKTAKPGQNPYFDWPVFGLDTVKSLQAAGVTTAALESEKVVLLGKPAVLAEARRAGIELYGFE